MKIKTITFLACSALFCLHPYAPAQVTVAKQATEVSLLNLSGFKAKGEGAPSLFVSVLQSDLTRSGWFTIISSGRAEFTIVGTVEQKSSKLVVKCEAYNVITKKKYLDKSYKHPANETRQLAHRVCDDLVYALTGRPGMAASRIVMVSNRTGHKELYICDADGRRLRQLTTDKTISLAPRFNSDGTQLLYTSYLAHFPDVYLVNLNTGSRKCIANYPGLNSSGAFAPNGREVALTLSKDGHPNLFIKDLKSGRLTRLTSTRNAADTSPSWSPDGKQIVFVSDRSGSPQLYTINRNGGEPRRITSRGSQNVDPDWGDNGFIVFASLVGKLYQIFVLRANLQITQISREDANYEDPSWAPDGRHIVCTRTKNYKSRIFIIDTLSDSLVTLLPDSITGEWFAPDWSHK